MSKESIMSVYATMIVRGGDILVVNALADGIKERLKNYRMKGAH